VKRRRESSTRVFGIVAVVDVFRTGVPKRGQADYNACRYKSSILHQASCGAGCWRCVAFRRRLGRLWELLPKCNGERAEFGLERYSCEWLNLARAATISIKH
jgi:hypothetical protein